ncbi:IS30 family transposase, partial [Neisseria meningitidis]|nr:IS30 family transposase [Neisseria meningitidis]
ICKLDSLKAEDTARAAGRALKAHKEYMLHTITMDIVKEFYQHTNSTKAFIADTYFFSPFHWEKGLNENTNGL